MRADGPGAMGMIRRLFLLLLLAGCASSPPARPDPAFVGHWHGPSLTLSLSSGGLIYVEQQLANGSNETGGPLRQFDGQQMVFGHGPLRQVLRIDRQPWQDGDQWKMVINGEELVRTRERVRRPDPLD